MTESRGREVGNWAEAKSGRTRGRDGPDLLEGRRDDGKVRSEGEEGKRIIAEAVTDDLTVEADVYGKHERQDGLK